MQPGLEGVVVAETVLSDADPERGMLWVRGQPIPQLAALGYEGTVALLWDGFVGADLTRAGMQQMLGAARLRAFEQTNEWLALAAGRPLDEAIRIRLALLPDESEPAAIPATLAVSIAAALRVRASAPIIAPDASLPLAADFLRMLHSASPDAAKTTTLDTYLAVMAESGMGPATFTARTVASTRASLTSAVVAAWCSFTGPLHGGAPGPTLDMLDAAAAADDLDRWIEQKLKAGERIAGFGHRVFRGNDPRAAALRARCTSWAQAPAACNSPRSSKRASPPYWRGSNPAAASPPTSRSWRRCCSTPSAFRATPSPRCSPSRAAPAGSRTRSSSKKPAA